MTDSARINALELAVEHQQNSIRELQAANERQAAQIAALLLTRSGGNDAQKQASQKYQGVGVGGIGGPVGSRLGGRQWSQQELDELKRNFAKSMELPRFFADRIVP